MSPMPGLVKSVNVSVGETVGEGQEVLIIGMYILKFETQCYEYLKNHFRHLKRLLFKIVILFFSFRGNENAK